MNDTWYTCSICETPHHFQKDAEECKSNCIEKTAIHLEQTNTNLVNCKQCKHNYYTKGHQWRCNMATNQTKICPYFKNKEEQTNESEQ